MELRKEQEKQHAKIIIRSKEKVLGWPSPAGQVRLARRTKLVADKANLNLDKLVIEIGCGMGSASEHWYHHCKKLIAVDISGMLLSIARIRHNEIVYITADAEVLPFKDNTADAVIGNSILHHVDIESTFSEVRRILKPGRKFAFAEPNMLNPQIVIEKNIPFIRKMLGNTPNETAFVRFLLMRSLKDFGFEEVKITPFDFLHPLVPPTLIPLAKKFGDLAEKILLMREIAGSLIISGRKE